MIIWNPWHGCKKYSSGCLNCYVYRRDQSIGKDSSIISKTNSFDLPLKRNRSGEYKITASDNPVYICMTSDFFIEYADQWRKEIWNIIRIRNDLNFIIITKRITRAEECFPENWGEGYDNVTIMCTCENNEEANKRLPCFLQLPIKKRGIICEPILENIEISNWLDSGKISKVICGGESGENARVCDFEWVMNLREQCRKADVSFRFKQTGYRFRKNDKLFLIKRKYQHSQADKAAVNYYSSTEYNYNEIFSRLKKSEFRSRFHLNQKDKDYIYNKGLNTIREHAYEFIRKRLSPLNIENDGKQTPVRGHPIFIAQHACACCCRDCLNKWHGITKKHELTYYEIDYIVSLLLNWIKKELNE